MFFSTPVTGNKFPLTRNILSFTGKMPCYTRGSFLFVWQEINFLWQKIFFLLKEKFLLWQILCSFCDSYYTTFIISSILPVTGCFSCNMDIFHVTKIAPPITRRTVCVTWSIFSVTEIYFQFALSEEIFFHVRQRNYFFLWHKM